MLVRGVVAQCGDGKDDERRRIAIDKPVRLSVEQSYTEVDELACLGAVYDQDTGNLQLQQQGLKATRKGITLENFKEARIRRFHLTLDEYLQAQT